MPFFVLFDSSWPFLWGCPSGCFCFPLVVGSFLISFSSVYHRFRPRPPLWGSRWSLRSKLFLCAPGPGQARRCWRKAGGPRGRCNFRFPSAPSLLRRSSGWKWRPPPQGVGLLPLFSGIRKLGRNRTPILENSRVSWPRSVWEVWVLPPLFSGAFFQYFSVSAL